MDCSNIADCLMQLRKKIQIQRTLNESIANRSRRNSFSDSKSLISPKIPKNTQELLQRYRNSRLKIPSYKLDATELFSSVLYKAIKRIFDDLREFTNEKNTITEFSNFFQNFKNEKTQKKNAELGEDKENFYKKHSKEDYLEKNLIKQENNNFLKINESVGEKSTKNLVPVLNLNKRTQSHNNSMKDEISSKNGENKSIIIRISQENSISSKKNSIITDRRSEKPQHTSTLPSSIFSDSEVSITDRVGVHVNQKKSDIQLKDIESFFEFNSFNDKKHFEPNLCEKTFFFYENEQFKKNLNKEKKFSFDGFQKKIYYKEKEVNHLSKILKDILAIRRKEIINTLKIHMKNKKILEINQLKALKFEKILAKSKNKRLKETFLSLIIVPKTIKLFLKKFAKISKKVSRRVTLIFFKKLTFLSKSLQNSQRKLKNFCKNIKKDQIYRIEICFNFWKTQTRCLYIEQLRFLSLDQHLSNLVLLKYSSVFTLLKLLYKKSNFLEKKQLILSKLLKKQKLITQKSSVRFFHKWKNSRSVKDYQIIRKKVHKFYLVLAKITKSRKHDYFSDINSFSLEDNAKKYYFMSKMYLIILRSLRVPLKKVFDLAIYSMKSHLHFSNSNHEIQGFNSKNEGFHQIYFGRNNTIRASSIF